MSTLVFCVSAWLLLSGMGRQASADAQAETLLKQVQAAYKAAQTLSADLTVHLWLHEFPNKPPRIDKGMVKLKKPNLARYVENNQEGTSLASNGSTAWWTLFVGHDELYREQSIASDGHDMPSYLMFIKLFFDQDMLKAFPYGGAMVTQPAKLLYMGTQKVEGQTYRILEVILRPNPSKPAFETDLLYIGKDGLIHRLIKTLFNNNKEDYMLANIRVNLPLANTDFAVRPPASAQKMTLPSGIQP